MASLNSYPWRQQKIESRGPTCNYGTLKEELPKPPDGVEWEHDAKTRKWRLVVSRKAPSSSTSSSNGNVAKPLREAATPNNEEDEIDNDKRSQPKEGEDFIFHTVLPTDTFQGLCLRYKIKPIRLRQINGFSGTNLRLARNPLVIPVLGEDGTNLLQAGKIRLQDSTTPEFKLFSMLNAFPHLAESERRAYLELADWDLETAIHDAKADEAWELQNKQAAAAEQHELQLSGDPKLDMHIAIPLDENVVSTPIREKELEMARRK